MGKFKVGDRVVVRKPDGEIKGELAWVWEDGQLDGWHEVLNVDSDGTLRIGPHGYWVEERWCHLSESRANQDTVNSPSHYQSENGIECIEAIRAQLTADEFRGYIKGNIAKYVWRERTKGGDESLRKAKWYLDKLIETLADNPSV